VQHGSDAALRFLRLFPDERQALERVRAVVVGGQDAEATPVSATRLAGMIERMIERSEPMTPPSDLQRLEIAAREWAAVAERGVSVVWRGRRHRPTRAEAQKLLLTAAAAYLKTRHRHRQQRQRYIGAHLLAEVVGAPAPTGKRLDDARVDRVRRALDEA